MNPIALALPRIAAGPRLRKLSALALAAALAGCTMAPAYVRPDAPLDAAYPTGPAYGEGEASSARAGATADIGWRDFFDDPLLHALIEASLANHRDLRVAALNVEAARARYRIQRSELLPRLAVVGEGASQRLPADLGAGATAAVTRQYQAMAAIPSWELDLWGRIRSLNRNALASYLSADETRAAAQLSLVAEVASAYLTLRADQELTRLASDTLAAQRRSHELVRQLAAAGAATELDLRRAEIALRTAESDHAASTRAAARDRNALVQLLGQPLTPDQARQLDAADMLADSVVPADLPAGLPSDLLARRPDIRAAEHALRGANARIGAARAAFFPTIRLTGSAGSASASLDGLFESGSRAWSFLPRITLPIFSGGALAADLDLARVHERIEIARYEKAIQDAFRDVADALSGRRTLDDQVRAERSRMEAGRHAHALAEQRFEAGTDDYLSVLDAQRTFYASQQMLVRARLARAINRIDLYKSLGGGWSERSVTANAASPQITSDGGVRRVHPLVGGASPPG